MTASSGTTSFTSLALGDEDLFLSVLNGSETFDPASIAAGATLTNDITVTGAALGGFTLVAPGVSLAGLVMTSYVSAADTVTVVLYNPTGGAVDLASSTWKAKVFT